MTNPQKPNDKQAQATAKTENAEATQQAAEKTEEDTKPETKDYILLDLVFVKYDDAENRKSRSAKKYKQGDRISLTAAEAVSLTAGPRPSVRALTKQEQKEDED